MSNLSSSYKDLKDLFKPFFKKNYPSPRSIIHKFASSKVSFKEKFYRQLPDKVGLSSTIKDLVNVIDTPISKKDFPDFLRALGAVCNTTFIGPKRMLFDISYGCNLDCVYCRRHSAINPGDPAKAEPAYKDSFLSLDRIRETLDDALELMVEEVLLVGGGEPTIHPMFEQLVIEVKKRGLGLNFSTNGLVLKPKLVDLIIDNGVDNITVSVSGVSFDSYKATHPMMSRKGYEKLYENFKYLNYRRRKLIQETGKEFVKPFTIFLHVITSDNYQEVLDMAFTGIEYGFDTVWYKLVHPSPWSRHLCLNPEQAKQVREQFKVLRDYQDKLTIKIDDYMDEEINNLDSSGDWSGYFHSQRRCLVGWNFSYMDLSEDYSFCCGDKIVGEAKDVGSFEDFWRSEQYANYRSSARDINFGAKNKQLFNDGLLIDDFCKSCDNTNFNGEMEQWIQRYGLQKFLPIISTA